MLTTVNILGIIVLFLMGFFLLVCIVNGIKKAMDNIFTQAFDRGFDTGKRMVYAEIRQKAWWFSEDKATMNLINNIFEGDTYAVREQWRKESDHHEDNRHCWCNPTYDSVKDVWVHKHVLVSKGN